MKILLLFVLVAVFAAHQIEGHSDPEKGGRAPYISLETAQTMADMYNRMIEEANAEDAKNHGHKGYSGRGVKPETGDGRFIGGLLGGGGGAGGAVSGGLNFGLNAGVGAAGAAGGAGGLGGLLG